MVQFLAFVTLMLALYTIYRGAVLLSQPETSLGFWRLAYAISGFWLGLPILLLLANSNWQWDGISQGAWIAWLMLALLPNAVFWALIWVLRGFRA